MNSLKAIAATLVVTILAACSVVSQAGGHDDYAPFPAVGGEAVSVDDVLAAAKAEDQRALIVIGANWCHDSRAFTKAVETASGQDLLDKHFQMTLINVGDFEAGFDTAARFGLPIYTHTPTVLIVDPATDQLVNWDDHYQFRDAARMSHQEVLDYLTAHISGTEYDVAPELAADTPAGQWAGETAARIRQGYAHILSLGGVEADGVDDIWGELRDVRYSFSEEYPKQLTRVAEGQEAGELPSYAPLSWEE